MICDRCNGKGSGAYINDASGLDDSCYKCEGTGKVTRYQHAMWQMESIAAECGAVTPPPDGEPKVFDMSQDKSLRGKPPRKKKK